MKKIFVLSVTLVVMWTTNHPIAAQQGGYCPGAQYTCYQRAEKEATTCLDRCSKGRASCNSVPGHTHICDDLWSGCESDCWSTYSSDIYICDTITGCFQPY